MTIRIYILLILLLLAFLSVSSLSKLMNYKKNKHKKNILKFTSLWNVIDRLSETVFIKALLLTPENRLYSNIESFLYKNSYPGLSNIRLQTICIVSVIISSLFYLLVWFNQSLSILLFNDKLQVLANEIGNPEIAKISMPSSNLIIFSSLSYFLPFLIFKTLIIVKGKNMESEALMLQSYTTMLLKTNTNIKYILTLLLDQANYYKEPLSECLHLFTIDQEKAFEKLKEKSKNIRFLSIVSALEKGLNYDRNMATQYLQNSKKLQTNLQKIEKQKRDKNKQLTGAVLLIMPLIAFAFTAGYPWFLLLQKLLTNLSSL